MHYDSKLVPIFGNQNDPILENQNDPILGNQNDPILGNQNGSKLGCQFAVESGGDLTNPPFKRIHRYAPVNNWLPYDPLRATTTNASLAWGTSALTAHRP